MAKNRRSEGNMKNLTVVMQRDFPRRIPDCSSCRPRKSRAFLRRMRPVPKDGLPLLTWMTPWEISRNSGQWATLHRLEQIQPGHNKEDIGIGRGIPRNSPIGLSPGIYFGGIDLHISSREVSSKLWISWFNISMLSERVKAFSLFVGNLLHIVASNYIP